MEILIFEDKDLTKQGMFKKKHNVLSFDEKGFIDYIKAENLTLSKGYIDLIGFISNNKKFRCYYNNMVIGVTGIINEINNIKEERK